MSFIKYNLSAEQSRKLAEYNKRYAPEPDVATKDGKVFFKGQEIREWKASPNPYASYTPRVMLVFASGERTNITGSVAGEVWAAIKGAAYPYGRGPASMQGKLGANNPYAG